MAVGPKLPRTCTLEGGRKVLLRWIRPDDRDALRAAFHRLEPETRYRRFMGHFADLTPPMLTYLTELDGHDHFAVVAVPVQRGRKRGATEEEEIVGVARVIRLKNGDGKTAEVAVTVTDALQGLGLGSKLLEILVQAANERGIERLIAHVLDGNAPMHRLLEKSGPVTRSTDGGVYVTLVRPPSNESRFPTPRSLRRGQEAVVRVLVAFLRRSSDPFRARGRGPWGRRRGSRETPPPAHAP